MTEKENLIVESTQKSCKYCKDAIKENALVCPNCGKDQRRAINIIKDIASITTLAMIGIAAVQVLINYGQFQELRAKRIEAAEVLGKAKVIFGNASMISNKAVKKADFVFRNASSVSAEAIKKSRTVLTMAEKSAESANFVTEKAEKEMHSTVRMVNEKQKELVEKFNRLDPLKQPIRSISATVEIIIDKKGRRNTQLDEPCFLGFAKDKNDLLFVLSSMDSFLKTVSNGWEYRGLLRAQETDSIIGKPISSLKQIGFIAIKFNDIKTKEKVISGRVVVVINNSIELDFTVPAQNTYNNNFIFIDNLASSLSVLNKE